MPSNLNQPDAPPAPVKLHEDHVASLADLHSKIDGLHEKFDALFAKVHEMSAPAPAPRTK